MATKWCWSPPEAVVQLDVSLAPDAESSAADVIRQFEAT